ncbi:embryogenesis-associated protein EMB8-like [Mangifera indica]|uniref:embryogenesis-associated protein EMB8-like n=1 Tax=Mangifera indica TaxID=29780 RepID=UPI001CFB0C3A|nr:embryogenesis-associated protein EMB8-like [Mangifera indica]
MPLFDESSIHAYKLLFNAFSQIPTSHYLFSLLILSLAFLYNFLEFHFFQDLFSGFRGSSVGLTFNSSCSLYYDVVSKCKILHGRYLATSWLSSPHIQTTFLHFFGRPPSFNYRRQLFHLPDGGMIALDWLLSSDASGGAFHVNNAISKEDTTPIVVVIPGLTSDSDSAYIKHLAFTTATRGWNVVVTNHRGLGGVSVTSDCFYNAGWTEDTREVVGYLHQEYPKAPLFAVGTSIGANILVKYLGEDGERTPLAGAVAICSPWDLLIGDRFICRRLLQKLYDRALAIGLQGYAQLHEPRYSRLANWEGIKKSRSIRDFDNHATCLVGKFETVDTYYRRCSSSTYVGNVAVPLLCISALDDPVCTREAIPWDECRANKNVVLATTQHGGHLAFFEGISAATVWWVRASDEFLCVLHSSPLMHLQKKESGHVHTTLETSIDQGPYVNVSEDGMVAALGNEQTRNSTLGNLPEFQNIDHKMDNEMVPDATHVKQVAETKSDSVTNKGQTCEPPTNILDVKFPDVVAAVTRHLNYLSRQNRRSIWLLAYVAIITTWPVLGSALKIIFKGKHKNVPAIFAR